MELYIKCLRRQRLFSDRQLGEFISGCLKRIDYSFGKVHFTSEFLECGLYHDKNGYLCKSES